MNTRNSCTFEGNLGSNPEVHTGQKNSFTTVSIATPRLTANGELSGRTDWVRMKWWNGEGERIAENFHVGDRVRVVAAEYNHDQVKGDDGIVRYFHTFVGGEIILLSRNGEQTT